MWLPRFRHFLRPPEAVYQDPERDFLDGYHTYGEYNYLRPGLASRVKAAHFEKALRLTAGDFGRTNVIDFGCADGVFLPSLAEHFAFVTAVDRVPMFAEIARKVVATIGARNVEVVCNEDLSMADLSARLAGTGRRYDLAFCLEVLEHVGEPGDLYGAKRRLVDAIFDLLEPGGRVVISVPTMVGLPFLIQRGALAAMGSWREPLSWSALLRAGFFKDTARLEPLWDGGHLGFNHVRMEESLSESFAIEERASIGFQMVYVVRRERA